MNHFSSSSSCFTSCGGKVYGFVLNLLCRQNQWNSFCIVWPLCPYFNVHFLPHIHIHIEMYRQVSYNPSVLLCLCSFGLFSCVCFYLCISDLNWFWGILNHSKPLLAIILLFEVLIYVSECLIRWLGVYWIAATTHMERTYQQVWSWTATFLILFMNTERSSENLSFLPLPHLCWR